MKNVLISAVVGVAAGYAACKFGPKVVAWGKEKFNALRERGAKK